MIQCSLYSVKPLRENLKDLPPMTLTLNAKKYLNWHRAAQEGPYKGDPTRPSSATHVEEAGDVGARDGRNALAGGVAEPKASVADAELRVREVEVLAALAVVLVLRRAVQDCAHVL